MKGLRELIGIIGLSGALVGSSLVGKADSRVNDNGFSVFGKIGCLMPEGNLIDSQYGANLNFGFGFGLESSIIGLDFEGGYYSDTGKVYEESYRRGFFGSEEDYYKDEEKLEIFSLEVGGRFKIRKGRSGKRFVYFGGGVGYQSVSDIYEIKEKERRERYHEIGEENFKVPYVYVKAGVEKPFENGSIFLEGKYSRSLEDDNEGLEEGGLETMGINCGFKVLF